MKKTLICVIMIRLFMSAFVDIVNSSLIKTKIHKNMKIIFLIKIKKLNYFQINTQLFRNINYMTVQNLIPMKL